MIFTSESVTEGHPDKVCDQISDAVLDAALEQDPMSRVACETMATKGIIFVSGEITTKAQLNISTIVKQSLTQIGYDPEEFGIIESIHQQSPDIAMGVDTGGAGDQGMMFGYATNETASFMPLPIDLANKLAMRLAEVRKTGLLSYLLPDGKTQVTVQNGKATSVVVSSHHLPIEDQAYLQEDIRELVISNVLEDLTDVKIYINPTGKFEVGGPKADTGLTGRKIIVDTYGGMAPHGGGAFSGKDPTKVDRSAAYMARHLAKSVVANKMAQKCLIQLAYVIGVAEPVSVMVETNGIFNPALSKMLSEEFDLRPNAIIDYLELRNPIYQKTAAYGHFGRDIFSWERIAEL